MKLTQLDIHGFKSFADRTRLTFDQGITGIVGPNGCGKSNVVDAIRWVLGEQKTKALRSDKMENVLFNGTDKRKRANLAEVSITFENTRNLLPTEFSTVTITRRLYRDGESEYLLNSVPCRLKDITNLFLDTGIGADSYAIIELGMVEDLLSDKNNARRVLFEEAAGVSKYKLRKKETFSRLEETETSLARVEDLLAEIEKNLKVLEKQAARAVRYLEVKRAYRQVSTRLALLKLDELAARQAALAVEEQAYTDKNAAAQREIAVINAEVEALRSQLSVEEAALALAQRTYNTYQEETRKLETDLALAKARLQYLGERGVAIETSAAGGEQAAARITEVLGKLKDEADAVATLIALQHENLTAADAARIGAQSLMEAKRKQLTELAAAARAALQLQQESTQAEVSRQSRLQALRGELARSMAERESRLKASGGFAEQIAPLELHLGEIEAALVSAEQTKAAHEAELATQRQRINTQKETTFQTQRLLDARQQEQAIIKGLVDSLEGFSESVKFLRQHPQWTMGREVPLLSDLFYTTDAYKVALEAVLEPYMNYYVAETRTQASAAVELLKSAGRGRAQFFILTEIATYMTGTFRPVAAEGDFHSPTSPLLAYTEFAEHYRPLAHYLLQDVYVHDGELSTDLHIPLGMVFVSKNGAVLARRLELSGGSVGLFEGKRIGRAKNLEKLGPEIKKLAERLEVEHRELDALIIHLTALEKQNYGQPVTQLQGQRSQLQQQLSGLEAKATEYRQLIAQVSIRTEDLEAQIARLQTEQAEAQPAKEAAKARAENSQLELEAAQKELEEIGEELNALQSRQNQENIKLVNLKNQLAGLEKDRQRQQADLERLTQTSQQEQNELTRLGEESKQLLVLNTQRENEIVERLAAAEMQSETIRAAEEQLQALKQSLQGCERREREARSVREELAQTYNALRDKITEYRIQQRSLVERMQVEFEIELADLDRTQVFDAPEAEYNLVEIERAVLELREQLQRFGEVNPTAVEAYQEVSERYTFITTQRDDLLAAKLNLTETMQEIDSTAREKFLAAFTQIQTNFQQIFRSLFTDQDTSELHLIRPDDPLESPIEITAKPKGKRPLTINQLSGGEKTLTAISLLFAIYLLKPAPFCIFDEVDAPLDDANVDKFTTIINDFSSGSQFIVVTHNKRTMVKTHVLYGVTMEETGISRVLPVNLVALNLD